MSRVDWQAASHAFVPLLDRKGKVGSPLLSCGSQRGSVSNVVEAVWTQLQGTSPCLHLHMLETLPSLMYMYVIVLHELTSQRASCLEVFI
jgi:hypothetical protein